MKKIISFYVKNVKTDSYIISTKARALAFVDLFGIVLLFLYITLTFLTGQYQDSVMRKLGVPFILTFVLLGNLFILKTGRFKLAGNLLPTSLLVVFLSFLFAFAKDTDINYYVAGYYQVLLFMLIGALFSELKYQTINFVLILGFVTSIFFLFHLPKHNEFSHFVQTGFLNFIFALVGIYVVLYFVSKFNRDALKVIEDALKRGLKLAELKELLSQVDNSARRVKKQSINLEGSYSGLNKAIGRQAANVEEISTSVEELTQTVVQGAENANLISGFSDEVYNELNELKKTFLHYIELSMQISNFTKNIIEIAEKTDILAINASIEAARAGEMSGGFKVIASEIRTLSENTKKIADSVIFTVENNNKSANLSKDKIVGLSKNMAKLNENTKSLAIGLAEEKVTLRQINSALAELNNDAQTNSITADQVYQTAKELITTSKKLDKIVSRFKKGD